MEKWAELRLRLKFLFSPGAALAVGTAAMLLLPQVIYWQYAYGQPFVYSCEGESFNHRNNPQLHKLWFLPHSGFFSHIPLLFVAVIGIGMMLRQRKSMGAYLAVLFLFISYLFHGGPGILVVAMGSGHLLTFFPFS